MANTKQAKKEIRAQARKRIRNLAVESRVKTLYKEALSRVEAGSDGTTAAVRLVVSELDKAASKGVLHPNKAARKKSRLMKRRAGEPTAQGKKPQGRKTAKPPAA